MLDITTDVDTLPIADPAGLSRAPDMRITFLGGTGTVTGSKYLLEAGKRKILVDCGLFQGYKQLRLRNRAPLPISPREIDAVVLTHAHIDHSGYLPLLYKQGFRGRVYCTAGTRDLCAIVLPDSGYLQEEEAAYANRRGYTRHSPAQPLYTKQDAERSLKSLFPIRFHEPVRIRSGPTIELLPSGHILGGSMVRVTQGSTTLLFTGDLGRPSDLIMKPPESVTQADYLVIESTYGDRLHATGDAMEFLAGVINRTHKRRGMLIVPSFAVSRAQLLLYLIYRLKRARRIPDMPVYLNSPMAANVNKIYRRYRHEHRLDDDDCNGMFEVAHTVASVEESKRLNHLTEPSIIVAASGMATGGRVIHHLKAYAPGSRNTILFPGFQAGGTRGAAIISGAESVKIHGEYVPVRAEVAVMEHLSAHADQNELLGWLAGFTTAPKMTFVTHGEPAASDTLRQKISEKFGWTCTVPEYRQTEPLQ
jgi:metallo-beta-lactamase family protein